VTGEGVEITLRDVYDEQRHTAEQLAGIGTQLATLTTRVDARLDAGQVKMADHESRLRTIEGELPHGLEKRVSGLERFRWQIAGALIVINVVIAIAAEAILRAK
jgi:hypothetical protein